MKFLYTITICGSLFLSTSAYSQNNNGLFDKTTVSEIRSEERREGQEWRR